MKEASFTELRSQTEHYFALVESGETVRVLRNGRPIAEIHPIARATCRRGSVARLGRC